MLAICVCIVVLDMHLVLLVLAALGICVGYMRVYCGARYAPGAVVLAALGICVGYMCVYCGARYAPGTVSACCTWHMCWLYVCILWCLTGTWCCSACCTWHMCWLNVWVWCFTGTWYVFNACCTVAICEVGCLARTSSRSFCGATKQTLSTFDPFWASTFFMALVML